MVLRSLTLGLIGRADIVEFWESPAAVYPVEYKRGKPKTHDGDRVQLCAQAMCLEEMLGVHIMHGALYYGRTKRRKEVVFDSAIRSLTKQTAVAVGALLQSGRTPRAVREPKCDNCSLLDLCLPEAMSPGKVARDYMRAALSASLEGGPDYGSG